MPKALSNSKLKAANAPMRWRVTVLSLQLFKADVELHRSSLITDLPVKKGNRVKGSVTILAVRVLSFFPSAISRWKYADSFHKAVQNPM